VPQLSVVLQRLLPALLLLCLSGGAALAAATPEQRGIAAFRNGDLDTAMQAFEEALQQTDTPSRSLRYNLGVVYYQLERYEDARTQFQALTEHRESAGLAHYNLGLIGLAENRELEAARDFERSFLLSDDDKIRALARRQLEKLDLDDLFAGSRVGARNWQGILAANLGYDNNPSLATDDESTSDGFAEIALATRGYLTGDAARGLRVDLNALARRYEKERDQSAAAVSAGLTWDQQWGAWHHGLGLEQDWLLDRDNDQAKRRTTLHHGMERPLATGSALFNLAASRITAADDRFKPLEGYQYRARVGYVRVAGNHRWEGGYEFIRDDRDDFRTDTIVVPFSANRHQLSGRWRFRVSDRFTLSAQAQFRESRFHDPIAVQVNDANFSQDRKDRRYRLGATARYRFQGDWSVSVNAGYQENSSNVDFYDYQRNVLSAGVARTF